MIINRVSRLSFEETVDKIMSATSLTVLCCTLNEIMMANDDREVRKAMERADILTPDGMPLVWYLRYKFGVGQRVYGPELMQILLTKNKRNLFIGDANNKKYYQKMGEYVELPFKEKFEKCDYDLMEDNIRNSRAKIIWVGLGAKKQILVANELRKRVPNRIYITVGAAFDFISGKKIQAPKWVRNNGMEWFYRMVVEPKRLIPRYTKIVIFLLKTMMGFGR